MSRHGGNKVEKGTYWDLGNGQRVDLEKEGVLPGDRKTIYAKIPPGLMLILGPVLGLLYVIFLPFIAIGTVAAVAGRKAVGGVLGLAGRSLSFGWRPSTAHLAGKKRKKKE
ncbi:MAG: hypothetical protein Kow0025_02810 [Thermodesulfovibrionales bacterium]